MDLLKEKDMKKIKYIVSLLTVSLLIGFTGCEDVLDIQPTDMISEEAVRNDPMLVDALLNSVYRKTRFQSGTRNDKNGYGGNNTERNEALLGVVAGELNVFAGWQEPFATAMHIITANGAPAQLDYWPYDNIRTLNEILQILEAATFDQEMVDTKSAEARWLRAYLYFELVKRYGGVPLITEPQRIDQPDEELYVSRNTEKQVYDFIAAEMDALVNLLPESYSSQDFGRPSKWAAYALKSRAMLYAGSIAKYGKVDLNGVVGIPANEAAAYYQKAYDAAMAVINSEKHPLYRQHADPVQNFTEIFVKDGNQEVIFAEIFDVSLGKYHSWNRVSLPDAFSAGGASNHRLYLESFEKFEYRDGSSGKLDRALLDGNTKFDLNALVFQRDPRFLATVFYPEMSWQGGTVYFHTNTIGTIPTGSDWPAQARQRDRAGTGFLVRKRVDEAKLVPVTGEDETDWIVFRTGEMYLNAAEAAFETGNVEGALLLINEIRNRAGMPDKTSLTVDEVRNERFVELFNEEHRYWDLRRWRIAEAELNGKGFSGVDWFYYIDENKYTLKLKSADFGQIRTFAEQNYYLPIGLGRRANNPNLVENPGY